ncbi:hypothetical protein [Wolbachia endosymbiont of Psylliodes chrysocephala]|uniref:hypothetical protein n=1 Tax=Wolbachia endosymbiont of Psylliodes chrysocephala TaxID=2883236 RepID=UPI00209E3745|nr:hypothetical protein [Wolbachia endosymbiont of Psylliodes chrysocephala]
MKAADTGFHPRGQCPYNVIPVPRHWDPASFFLDPSVSYSDDTLLNRHTAIHSRYLKA